MTLTDYELERQRRIEENKRKLEQLCLPQMLEEMEVAGAAEQGPKKRRALKHSAAGLEPSRRSKRTEGRERPCYIFEAERGSGGLRPPRDGPLVKEGECEEVYGLKHVLALGSTDQGWEMFTDGYNSAGERIYDSNKGLSCHQCRQKTLGQRTRCSRCKSGLGVLCGDCLFARYGEHVEEATANKSWVCPCCRDLCNCSRHRKLHKWEATGQLHRSVKSRGYLSVAHYLVLNKVGGLAAKRAALASGFCPPDLAEQLEKEVKELEETDVNAQPAEEQPVAAETAAEAPAQGGRRSKGKGKCGPDTKPAGHAATSAAAKHGKVGTVKAVGGKAAGGKKRQQVEGTQRGKNAAGSKGPPKQAAKRKAASLASSPAAASCVLETSGASGSGAFAADASAGTEAEVATVSAAVAVTMAEAAKGGAGKSGKGLAGWQGTATLEEAVLAAPSRRRQGRN